MSLIGLMSEFPLSINSCFASNLWSVLEPVCNWELSFSWVTTVLDDRN